MEAYVTDLFEINSFFLKNVGVWSLNDKTGVKYKAYKVYQFFAVTVILVLFPLALFVNIVKNVENLSLLMEIMYPGSLVILSAMKVYFFLRNGDRIKGVMYSLECSDFRYEKIGDFDQQFIMQKAKEKGIFFTRLIWSVAQLTLFLTYGSAFVKSFWYFLKDMPISNVLTFQYLPTRLYIPFQHDTALKYLFACVLQFVPLAFYIMVISGIDGLFMNLLNVVAEHMVVLQGAFRTMRRRCLITISGPHLGVDGLNSDDLEEQMLLEMKKCVRHLQMIFQSCRGIEEIFKYVCLIQSIGTLLAVCDSLLLLSSTDFSTREFRMYVCYLVAVVAQLSLYCWSGNNLTLKAMDLPLALWENDWLEARKPYKVCMVITMIRLQKPLILTAGKFVPLLLSTQLSVLKAGYSYFTVLNGR